MFFGGHGRALAAPLSVGWTFASLSFPTAYGFGWVKPFPGFLGFLHFSAGVPTIDHPVQFLRVMGSPGIEKILFGGFPQPWGNSLPLVLLLCGLVVLLFRAVDFTTAVSFFLTMGVLNTVLWFVLPGKIPSPDGLWVGDFLFAGFFVLSDLRTAARTREGRFVTGVLAGFLAFLIRFFAASPDGAYFAVLATNSFCPLIDEASLTWSVPEAKT